MRASRCCAVLVSVVVTGVGCGSDSHERARGLKLSHNRHSGVFIGVSCRHPNRVSCDRVGLAVWLAKPAKTLVAEIEGRPLELVSPGELVRGKGTGWEGYLKPAGLRDPGGPLELPHEPGEPANYWSGRTPVDAEIRLTAGYADGSTATKTIRAPLNPGWG